MTPEELQAFLGRVTEEGVVMQLYRLASVKEADVLASMRQADLDVYTLDDVRALPTHRLDPLAEAQLRQARRMGALSGMTWGAGGILTAPPEMLHLMVATLRIAQRLALTYGQEFETFRGNLLLWEALSKAFGVPALAFEGAETEAFRRLPVPFLNTQAIQWNPVILAAARQVMVTAALLFVKRRWTRIVPVVGIGLSGVGNYSLLKRIGRELQREFRRQHVLGQLEGRQSSAPIDFRVNPPT